MERAAFMVPSPSGPTRSTSRARLGRSAWCEKPSISAPPVSSMSTRSVRSRRIMVTKSTMPRHTEPVAARAAAGGADARRNGIAPAR